uniref:Protein SCO1/2 n=1 Tax=Candidatus Kentrum sp. FM TaxID=2126340 RepID=A0A450WYA1_9GAMM|nr:MAG: protein SCO1/2 [Candidatus Kentron sp. FM]VFJ77091.1 MAG: protein SCO1/2 [Candidatus Kentron sp. FM]VFK22024.1 MAG: protein SCO1/2 [Candidatus Kentron sp. FM]
MSERVIAEHHRSSTRRLITGIGLALVVLGALWFSVFRTEKSIDLGTTATVLAEPRPFPAFTLTDHQGHSFTEKSLHGQWTFLYFGYTSCPDVCPPVLATLIQTDRILRETPVPGSSRSVPRVVFVSLDPERDTKERIMRYLSRFNPDFLGATGTEEEIRNLTRQLGVTYHRSYKDKSGEDYIIDHSSFILLTTPQGRIRATFFPPHNPAAVAEDFRKILAILGNRRGAY